MTTPAWISLGSNLGDRRAILDEAVIRLNQTPGVAVTTVSTYRETAPVGGPPGQGPFLNAAARLDTTLSPRELLGAMQAIERDLGRVRTVRWGERTLDLDILIYGCKFVDEPDLKLPHPRLAVRRFVLEPLAEIAPEVGETTTRRKIEDLLENLNRLPRIVMIDDYLDKLHPLLYTKLAEALSGLSFTFESIETGYLSQSVETQVPVRDRRNLLKILLLRFICENSLPDLAVWTVFNFAVDVHRFRSIALHDATFIVGMNDKSRPCKLGMSSTPVYHPEATELDAIVAEVVAVCRGIEGG